ncbi:MAG: ATP-grasp domain-containing protein [Achromobacter sp.]|uniref:ATP-grasp domain-containing protein n=1 Tax=Achromobacter sp. TaxID=134375 RepID=UPI0012D03D24|nr:ATP-grasp domain-containing protein [Achromobacter sp.]MPS79492.1 ATP-grasp domain-containing protein [Achromobacter sp.]
MKVLSLGGGIWQLGLLQALDRLGFDSAVIDINPNCPGRHAAKEFVQGDTSDLPTVIHAARSLGVDFVIAEQSDRFVRVASRVNHALQLPGVMPNVADRFTDKSQMRQLLLGKVPMPDFQVVHLLSQALAFGERVGYPLVIKPKSSQSSYGVFKVNNPQDLKDRFNECLAFSTDGELLLESFVDGIEVTVEGLSINGQFHALAVSEKEHYAFNPCVAKRLSYPPTSFDSATLSRIVETAATVVGTLGLDTGLSHAEYRVKNEIPYLVEVAARGGGTQIAAKILPHICQFSPYDLMLRQLAGEFVSVPTPAGRSAVLMFLEFEPGLVKKIHGIDKLIEEGVAEEISLAFREGSEIVRPQDDTQRLGYALVFGENRADVDSRCQRIKDAITLEYE